MTTLQAIIDELQRQADESRAGGLGWFDPSDPKDAVVDGHVDLVALADAVDRFKSLSTSGLVWLEPVPSGPLK